MCSTLPLLPRLMDCCRVRCSLALDSYRWPRLVLPRNEMVPNGKLWRNGCICRLYVDIQISYPDNQVPWSMDLLKHIKDFSNNNCNMSNFSQAKWNYLLFTQAFLIDRLRYLTACKSRGSACSKWGVAEKWLVYFMENPIKMDDLGVALFQETPIHPKKC